MSSRAGILSYSAVIIILFSKYSNLCDHGRSTWTSQMVEMDRQTGGRTDGRTDGWKKLYGIYAQNPLDTFPRSFPEDGELPFCCQLVTDLLATQRR